MGEVGDVDPHRWRIRCRRNRHCRDVIKRALHVAITSVLTNSYAIAGVYAVGGYLSLRLGQKLVQIATCSRPNKMIRTTVYVECEQDDEGSLGLLEDEFARKQNVKLDVYARGLLEEARLLAIPLLISMYRSQLTPQQ